MDAYAFAFTLGTAELAAMTVLGFHLAGLDEIVGPVRRDGAEASAPPRKLPARPGRAGGD